MNTKDQTYPLPLTCTHPEAQRQTLPATKRFKAVEFCRKCGVEVGPVRVAPPRPTIPGVPMLF